jgi:hypothetical protein
MPEEDFENKKLLPILKEAFDLIRLLEKKKQIADKEIAKIKKQRKKFREEIKNYDKYKKAQVQIEDMTEDERKKVTTIYKSIMCPLKDKCSKDKSKRWPASNIKSCSQFGQDCPYAHHPSELQFPEQIYAKMSSTKNQIHTLEKSKIEESKNKVFTPASALYDCKGRCQPGSKAACNKCTHDFMAAQASDKLNNPSKKARLYSSINRKEGIDLRRSRTELSAIKNKQKEEDAKGQGKNPAKIMDYTTDSRFSEKFGKLKKACVLFEYGRINDAFDEIATAAKIVQDQMEINKEKQRVLEKRWKFKLGLDDGFELPVPIEKIDVNKLDEAQMRKMDLPGITL